MCAANHESIAWSKVDVRRASRPNKKIKASSRCGDGGGGGGGGVMEVLGSMDGNTRRKQSNDVEAHVAQLAS